MRLDFKAHFGLAADGGDYTEQFATAEGLLTAGDEFYLAPGAYGNRGTSRFGGITLPAGVQLRGEGSRVSRLISLWEHITVDTHYGIHIKGDWCSVIGIGSQGPGRDVGGEQFHALEIESAKWIDVVDFTAWDWRGDVIRVVGGADGSTLPKIEWLRCHDISGYRMKRSGIVVQRNVEKWFFTSLLFDDISDQCVDFEPSAGDTGPGVLNGLYARWPSPRVGLTASNSRDTVFSNIHLENGSFHSVNAENFTLENAVIDCDSATEPALHVLRRGSVTLNNVTVRNPSGRSLVVQANHGYQPDFIRASGLTAVGNAQIEANRFLLDGLSTIRGTLPYVALRVQAGVGVPDSRCDATIRDSHLASIASGVEANARWGPTKCKLRDSTIAVGEPFAATVALNGAVFE